MTEMLYLDDAYLKEFEALVVEVNGKFVVLDKTAFYAVGGGQPEDHGLMVCDGNEYKVVFVKKISGNVSHEVDNEGLKVGDKVKCKVNWERRYKLMRMHTAAHIISGVFFHSGKVKITGGNLGLEKSRIDFALENFDRGLIEKYIVECNEIVLKDLTVKNYYMDREEADKDQSMFKLSFKLPESIKKLRITEIVGFDKQADGGTHVKSTKDVGKIVLLNLENKGKSNRRLYFKLE